MALDIDQYQNFLSNLATQAASLGSRLLEVPTNEFIAELDYRITQLGLDSHGNKIGDYSKEKMYAGVDEFDNKGNFKPINRKDGSKRKTVTLDDGYWELRGLQGYRNDRIVLERTGAGIKNIKSAYDENTGVMEVGFTDLNESVKFRGLEERRDVTVLEPTAEEINNVKLAQIREINLFLKEIIPQ